MVDLLSDVFSTTIDLTTILVRLLMAFVLCGIIGVERESNSQPAGLRTHALIGLGSCLLMLLSIFVAQKTGAGANDPGRIAAQVVSGIGFLGAGAIMRLGADIRGLTTAATIWVVAALGLAIGAGLYVASVIACILILVVLIFLDWVEKKLFPKKELKELTLSFRAKRVRTEKASEILDELGIKTRSVDVEQALHRNTVRIKFVVYIPRAFDYGGLYQKMHDLSGVYKITIENLT